MEANLEKQKNVIVCNHPITQHNLTIMRDKSTSSELFRGAAGRLVESLLFHATDNLPTIQSEVETPLKKEFFPSIDPNAEIIIAPILRAGLSFSEVAMNLLPQARVHHVGLYRDEKTLQPVSYYNNLPKSFPSPENIYVYILDPMLATGGSAVATIKLFHDLKIPHQNIRFLSLISAPEGINKLQEEYRDVKIITACIDSHLNENGYIVPGLGDAGDRIFNTIYAN